MHGHTNRFSLAALVALTSLAASAADVAWQFTGATNRTAVSSAQVSAGAVPLRFAAKAAVGAPAFESRLTVARTVPANPFSSMRGGAVVIVR